MNTVASFVEKCLVFGLAMKKRALHGTNEQPLIPRPLHVMLEKCCTAELAIPQLQ